MAGTLDRKRKNRLLCQFIIYGGVVAPIRLHWYQAKRWRRLDEPRDAAPELPRGLLLDHLWTGWLETALTLGCEAVVCKHTLWDTSSVTQAKSAGFRTLSYTANDEVAAQRLIDLGTDGIITDRVDLFAPAG